MLTRVMWLVFLASVQPQHKMNEYNLEQTHIKMPEIKWNMTGFDEELAHNRQMAAQGREVRKTGGGNHRQLLPRIETIILLLS